MLYFEESSPLQKELVHVLSNRIKPEKLALFNQVFLELDPHCTGMINLKQLRKGYDRLGGDLKEAYLTYSAFMSVATDLNGKNMDSVWKHFKIDSEDLDKSITDFAIRRGYLNDKVYLKLRNEIKSFFEHSRDSREDDLFQHLCSRDTATSL